MTNGIAEKFNFHPMPVTGKVCPLGDQVLLIGGRSEKPLSSRNASVAPILWAFF